MAAPFAVGGAAAEGVAHARDGAAGLPFLQLGRVEGVAGGVAAADEEEAGGEGGRGGELHGTFLDEAAEGGEAGAGADEARAGV